GALQQRVSFVGPDTLQIGFAPGRVQRRWSWRTAGSGWCLSRRLPDRRRNDGAGSRNGDHYHRAWERLAHDGLLLPSGVSAQGNSCMNLPGLDGSVFRDWPIAESSGAAGDARTDVAYDPGKTGPSGPFIPTAQSDSVLGCSPDCALAIPLRR